MDEVDPRVRPPLGSAPGAGVPAAAPAAPFSLRVAAALVLLGGLARMAPLALPFDFQGPDTQSYLEPAHGLASAGAYVDAAGRPTAARPPGYPALLALVFLIDGSLLLVRVLQALLGGLAAAAVYAILGRRERPRLALAGGLLVALDPIAIGQSPFILREALLLGLLVGVVWALTALRGRLRALVGGLLLAGLALTHQLYMLLPAFLVALDLLARGPRAFLRGWRPWTAMALVVILAVLLWARRTERVVGTFSIAATENAVPARELWFSVACTNDWLSGDPSTGFQAQAFAEERVLIERHGLEGTRRLYYQRFAEAWREDPLLCLGRLLRLNFWYWVELPGAVRLAEHPRLFLVRWALLPFHWARLAAALAGAVALLRDGRWRRYRFALAALAFLGLAPALLYPVPRYLAPGAPLLDLLAVLGVAALLERRAAARRCPAPQAGRA